MTRLARIDWPDFGAPEVPPEPELAEYRARLSAVRAAMARHGWDALVIHADREHAANLHWLTGVDPRFEEAVLVVTPDAARLILGNECLPWGGISPLVQAGEVETVHGASLSLMSQPRGTARVPDLMREAIPAGVRVGVAGWKWFEPGEVEDPATALDLPAWLADPLRAHVARAENATAVFMHPAHGLRTRADAAEIARAEFANHMAAAALRRMVFALRPGMTDFAAVEAARLGGLPLGCHVTFAAGARAAQGLSGPTGQVLEDGPASFNICHWRANICRAGWLARWHDGAPEGYLEEFVFPYVEAMSEWCALMRPGVPGGAVWEAMRVALPFERFGVTLNPGHLIGVDEWVSSPIREGSGDALASGMLMQMDVIPGHPVWGSTRMEDGYAIADADLRADLEARYPEVAARCAARAAFMREEIGMDLPETLLPLADTCGIVAPFLYDPGQVVTLR